MIVFFLLPSLLFQRGTAGHWRGDSDDIVEGVIGGLSVVGDELWAHIGDDKKHAAGFMSCLMTCLIYLDAVLTRYPVDGEMKNIVV